MSIKTGLALFVGFVLLALAPSRPAFAQACKDEETMVNDYQQSMTELIGAVKKENLVTFENAYHQRSAMTKLTLFSGVVDGLVSCLEKASADATATKEQVSEYKTKHDDFVKMKDRIQKDRNALKSAEAPKDAKALIEKLDYTK